MDYPLNSTVNVTINICTFKRPVLLKCCIDSITAQEIPSNWSVKIVVINNDPNSNHSVLAKQYHDNNKIQFIWITEPRIGIPFARNRALQESYSLNSDLIIFIDDDEEALDGWLVAYHKALIDFDAEIYTGPVQHIFPSTYEWLANKGLNGNVRGKLLKSAASNNVMIKTNTLDFKNPEGNFDTDMRYSGGSDNEFFTRLALQGKRIVFVSDAVVSEQVNANRLTLNWRLKRQFHSSIIRVYIERKLEKKYSYLTKGIRRTLRHLIEGILRLLLSICFLFYRQSLLKKSLYHALRHFAKGLGTLFGILNKQLRFNRVTD